MEESGTEKKELKMDDYIPKVLTELKKIREKEGEWCDDDYHRGSKSEKFLLTCEALETFFTPMDLYPSKPLDVLKKQEVKLSRSILDPELLKEDLNYLMDIIEREGWPPAPYLKVEQLVEFKNGEKKEFKKGITDFVDSASFAFTSLVDAILYFNKFYPNKLEEEFKNKILKYAKESLQWLVDNVYEVEKDGQKFAYYTGRGKESKIEKEDISSFKKASIYFTYTGLVALTYTKSYKDILNLSEEELDQYTDIIEELMRWLFSIILETNEGVTIDYPGLKFNENFSSPEGLFVYILMSDYYCSDAGIEVLDKKKKRDKLVGVAKKLLEIRKDRDMYGLLTSGGAHRVPVDSPKPLLYPDRYISSLVLATFSYLSTYLYSFGRSLSSEEKEILGNLNKTVDSVYKELLSVANAKYEDGDVFATDSILWAEHYFQMYLNQRAIESLTLYSLYKNKSSAKYMIDIRISESELKEIIAGALSETLEDSVKEFKSSIVRGLTPSIIGRFKKNSIVKVIEAPKREEAEKVTKEIKKNPEIK